MRDAEISYEQEIVVLNAWVSASAERYAKDPEGFGKATLSLISALRGQAVQLKDASEGQEAKSPICLDPQPNTTGYFGAQGLSQ